MCVLGGGGGEGGGAAPSASVHYACVLLQNVGARTGSGTRPVSRVGKQGLTTASYSCPTQGRANFFFGPTFDLDFSATPGQSTKAWAGTLLRVLNV